MIDRYKYRKIAKNDMEEYSEVFRKRGLRHISQYMTPKYFFPTKEEYAKLTIIKHVWQEGDRYYKLAEKYYGDARDWWIIAKFNQRPTEAHIQVGDVVEVPTPLEQLLTYMTG